MTHPIPQDDLAPGMWVTIRDRPAQDDPPPTFLHAQYAAWMARQHHARRAAIRPGRPMRVLAVDLPFLHVTLLDVEGDETAPSIIDLREQPIVRCEASVAESLKAFGRRRRAEIRARVAKELHENAMEEVQREIDRHKRLLMAGIVPQTPRTIAHDPHAEQQMLHDITTAPSIEQDGDATKKDGSSPGNN